MSDTLFLREDGTYRQQIHFPDLEFEYESEWQAWTLELREWGVPYLHLTGMRLCVSYLLPSCASVGGGDAGWWDFCGDRVVRMPGEGVLIVMGALEQHMQPPRGIYLVPLSRDPDTAGYSYQLQQQSEDGQ
jgi:hypothetical protein